MKDPNRRHRGPTRPRGATLEGVVRDLGHEGDAVVETERGLVLVAGALPAERVTLLDVTTRGGVTRAAKVRVREPAPERVTPACSFAERCGGCPLMIASETLERAHKVARVERELAAVPRSEGIEPLTLTSAGQRTAYRRRARLGFKGSSIGYHARRDRRLVDVDRCVVLDPALQLGLDAVRATLAPLLSGSGELRLAIGEGGRPVVALSSQDAQLPALYDAVRALVGEGGQEGRAPFAGASIAFGRAAPAAFGELVEVGTDPEGRVLRSAMPGFSQANGAVNEVLGLAALEAADEAMAATAATRVVELFAGHGNLTLGLAQRARERGASVDSVELDASAAAACVDNLAREGLPARVIAGDAEAFAIDRDVRVVVLDPPRSGARGASTRIAASKVSRVIYVSCDPATLARDLAILGEAGFELDLLRAFDMFPSTAHVEVLARMRRAK